MKVEYKKQIISDYQKISSEALNTESFAGLEGFDFINDLFTVKIESYFYQALVEQKEYIYYAERPSFRDWFFRRRRAIKVKIDVNDILLNPPKQASNTVRTYVTYSEGENLIQNEVIPNYKDKT